MALIGDIDYDENKFDLITSMDTIYFAPDISAFVSHIYKWLKPNGIFMCGYQEGDIMQKTENHDTTMIAKALIKNGIGYDVINYTKETYDMLKHKREVILSMKEDFIIAGIEIWYDVIKSQTDSILCTYDEYRKTNARYIFSFKKDA